MIVDKNKYPPGSVIKSYYDVSHSLSFIIFSCDKNDVNDCYEIYELGPWTVKTNHLNDESFEPPQDERFFSVNKSDEKNRFLMIKTYKNQLWGHGPLKDLFSSAYLSKLDINQKATIDTAGQIKGRVKTFIKRVN